MHAKVSGTAETNLGLNGFMDPICINCTSRVVCFKPWLIFLACGGFVDISVEVEYTHGEEGGHSSKSYGPLR